VKRASFNKKGKVLSASSKKEGAIMSAIIFFMGCADFKRNINLSECFRDSLDGCCPSDHSMII